MFHPDRRLLSSGAVSALVHAGVLAAILLGPLRPHRVAEAVGSPLIISWPQAPWPEGTTIAPLPGPVTPILLEVPPQPPIGIPPSDRALHFDGRTLLGADRAAPRSGGDRDGGEAWTTAVVEEPPVLLAGRQPSYPEALRAAGITGRVVVQAVIDTLGRAEPEVTVVESSYAGFDPAALDYVRRAVFRPGRVHGRPVCVLIRLPVDFRLTSVQ